MSENRISGNKNWKKLLSLVLSAVLVSAAMPQGVFAEPEETVSRNEFEEEKGGKSSVLFSSYSDEATYTVTEEGPKDRNVRLNSAPAHNGTVVLESVFGSGEYRDGKNVNQTETMDLYLGTWDPALSTGLDEDKDSFSADKAGTGSHHLKSIYLVSKDGTASIPIADSTVSEAVRSNMAKASVKADYQIELELTGFDLSKAVNGTDPIPAGEYYVKVTLNGNLITGASGGQTVFSTTGDNLLTVTGAASNPPVITSSSFSGMEGKDFRGTLSANAAHGGAITWSEPSGTGTKFSDIGLTLSSDGKLSGTLKNKDGTSDTAGNQVYHISVIATEEGNSDKARKEIEFMVMSGSSFSIETTRLPEATYGKNYSVTLRCSMEAAWSIEEGQLPDGLTLNLDTGVISGTPASGTCGVHDLKFRAVYKEDANVYSTSALKLTVRGEYAKIMIPKAVTDSVKGIPCWLQADFTSKGQEINDNRIWSGNGGEENIGATISSNEAVAVPVKLYGGDVEAVFRNVKLMANVAGENEPVVIASYQDEKRVEGGENIELVPSSPTVTLTTLPKDFELRDARGEVITGTTDQGIGNDIKVSYFCVADEKTITLSPGDVVRSEKEFTANLTAFSCLWRKYPDSYFDGYTVNDGNGQSYVSTTDPSPVVFNIPDYEMSEHLSGRVLYALSGGEGAKNLKMDWYQYLPGGRKGGQVTTGNDGSFNINVYPDADVYLNTPLSYKSDRVDSSRIGNNCTIYVNPGDTSACLDLTVSYPSDNSDSDTARYIKALPSSGTNLKASAGGMKLCACMWQQVRNTDDNTKFRIWHSLNADTLQNLADSQGSKTVKVSWDGSSVLRSGSQEIEVNGLLQGSGHIYFPVKGGIIQKVTNTSPINIHLSAKWFDHGTGKYLGESGTQNMQGLGSRELAFYSPEDAGTYDIAIISTEIQPVIENWEQFNKDYGSEGAFRKYEGITIKSGCGTLLPDTSFDLEKITEQLYITKPRSSASAPAQYSVNEMVPVTGTIALDEGFSGEMEDLYIRTNTSLECAVIEDKRYEIKPTGHVDIGSPIKLPCKYTVYVLPRTGRENLELSMQADINVTSGSQSESYRNQPVGEVQVAAPGLLMQLPDSAGSLKLSARLLSSPPIDDSGHKIEPYCVAVFDGDEQIYSESSCYGIKDRVVDLELLDTFEAGQTTHFISAKTGKPDGSDWRDTVTGEVVIGQNGTPCLKAHYLDLYWPDGSLYDSLMSGKKYDWGPHRADSFRVRAEFENDRYLDTGYGRFILGDEAPAGTSVVFSVKLQNGQSLRLPGIKESDGVYVSEKQKITSPVIQTQVDYAVKRDNFSLADGIDFDAPMRPYTDGVMEKTDIYALNRSGDLSDEKLSLIDVGEVRVNADDYASCFHDEDKLYEDIKDHPEDYKDIQEALEKGLLDNGCCYVDPDTGKIDEERVPEWTHVDGDESKAPNLTEVLENITVEGDQSGVAVSSLAVELDKDRYEKELNSFMSTDFDHSRSPSTEVKEWKGDIGSIKISAGSGDFMAPSTCVITDKYGRVLVEQTTCFYMSDSKDGSSVLAQVQLTKARDVDDNGNIKGDKWIYGEDANIIGIGSSSTSRTLGDSGDTHIDGYRPNRHGCILLFGTRVTCPIDLVSFFIDGKGYSYGSASSMGSDALGGFSNGLSLLVSRALLDGISGPLEFGFHKFGQLGDFYRGVNAAAGLLASGCTTYSTIASMKSLADNYYEVECLTKTKCFKKIDAKDQLTILKDLDSFNQETNDAMFWTLVHGGFNSIFSLGATFGINKGTKELIQGHIFEKLKPRTWTQAGRMAGTQLGKYAGYLVIATAVVVTEAALASLVSFTQNMQLDEHRWMLEQWIADDVEKWAEFNEDESCGYKKKKKEKDKEDDSGKIQRSTSSMASATYAPIYDPSGVVYAGVKSMPVEGASVKLYTNGSSDLSNDFLAPADPSLITPETNELKTGSDGRYAWMVPEGDWFVTADADGFIGGSSNNDTAATHEGSNYKWLPVPPPQMDVNIPLKSMEAPGIEEVIYCPDGVYVIFDKYMNTGTENGLMKDGAFILRKDDPSGDPVPFTVELLDKETEPDNIIESERHEYARSVLLNTGSSLNAGDTVYLEIDGGIVSYSGIRFGDAEDSSPRTGTVSEKETLASPSLTDESASYGEVPQNSMVDFSDVSIASNKKVKIYYTVDGSDPSDINNSSRVLYDGSSILIGQSMTIKAVATRYGYKDSSIASFEYIVKQHGIQYHFLDSDKYEEKKDEDKSYIDETKPSETTAPVTAMSVAEIGGYTFRWSASVSYNGRKHYPVIEGGQGKNTKSKWSDVIISIVDSQGTVLQGVKIKGKVKKGRDAGKASMILKLKGKQYKALNKLLKHTPLTFDVNPADISDPGLPLDVKFDRKGGIKKVYCTLSGKKIKLDKRSYTVQPSDSGVTIEASGNFTGKRKLDRSH